MGKWVQLEVSTVEISDTTAPVRLFELNEWMGYKEFIAKNSIIKQTALTQAIRLGFLFTFGHLVVDMNGKDGSCVRIDFIGIKIQGDIMVLIGIFYIEGGVG